MSAVAIALSDATKATASLLLTVTAFAIVIATLVELTPVAWWHVGVILGVTVLVATALERYLRRFAG